MVFQYKQQNIDREQFDRLTEFYKAAVELITEPVNLIFWIDTPSKLCFEKLQKMDQREFSLDQIQLLGDIIRKWLHSVKTKVPVVHINTADPVWESDISEILNELL